MNRVLTAVGLAFAISVAACGAGVDERPDDDNGPVFAPDDLAATLPRDIEGAEVTVRTLSPDDLRRLLAIGAEQAGRLAERLSRDPTSVIGATAWVVQQGRVSSIIALRSKGVAGEELVWHMVELTGPPTEHLQGAVEVGAKGVSVRDPGDTSFMLHDVGEVMYLIHATDRATADAILAALP